MNFRKRIIALGLLVVLLVVATYYAHIGTISEAKLKSALGTPKETIHIWYTDEALTDYINCAAVNFNDQNNIRVVPVLTSGLEYLESINKASVEKNEMPDLYILSNDALEKAYLAGLASEVEDTDHICTTDNYPETALKAVTYQDKLIGYPFYYETSVFLYNKTYMDDVAKTAIESEADATIAEETQTEEVQTETAQTESVQAEADVSQKAINEKIDTVIPKTIDDILTFADEYDAPEAVEAVFKWNVSDIFYNYFFVGNYMIVGGETGDNTKNIDIYNQDTIDCLQVYQNLNQFFSIDTKEVTYDSVLQDFMDGKIVFSVVTTDAIAKIEEAKAKGTFNFDYGVATIPNVSDKLQSKSLSVTNAVVVNGYSEKKDAANQFAKFLASDSVSDLYGDSGKVASKLDVPYENSIVASIMDEYKQSIPMPKMIETSNYWVQLEIAFTKIWLGEDVNVQLKQLSEQIMTQVTGTPYEEEEIVEPVEEVTEEYIDEGM